MTDEQNQLLYIGTYTHQGDDRPNPAESIYIYELYARTGELNFKGIMYDAENPSFLALAGDGQRLFAVNEVGEGRISAFAVNAEATGATFINSQATRGSYPCHITLDASEKWALIANYGGGSIAALPIAADGKIGEAASFIQNEGHSIDPERQEAPHAHSVTFDPAGQHVLVADLGLDQILVFKFEAATGQLTPHEVPFVALEPGTGPRHVAFHPNGRWLYVTGELNSTMSVYAYDQGRLTHQQTVSSLPADFDGENYPAHVEVAASGQFLYMSNRGHDSIAVFAIDTAQGGLSLIETAPCGKKPRHFTLDRTGNWLLVAHQDDNSVIVFQVEPASGKLTRTEISISIPMPVCIKTAPGR